MFRFFLSVLISTVMTASVRAQDSWIAQTVTMTEGKAVFATVESVDLIQARARTGGTIGELRIDEGSEVVAGDVLAIVVDDRLAPQIGAVNSQASGLRAQRDQAQLDLDRAQGLFDRGIFPQARLDEARTQLNVLQNQLSALQQQRAVLVQQSREGDVIAPSSGRVLTVPVSAGSVILPGETIALIASDIRVLRLRLPERHARFIAVGDSVRVDVAALTEGVSSEGHVRQVYPRIEDGRIIADVSVAGLGNYFIGERVRVHVGAGERSLIAIPEAFLRNYNGVDTVQLREEEHLVNIVIQRGADIHTEDGLHVEILSGLSDGDVLVRP